MTDQYKIKRREAFLKILGLAIFTLLAGLISLGVGRYAVSLPDILRTLSGERISPEITQVIWKIRLPRILAGMLVGGALALSGTAYQGMFKNPLVSPDILGSSAGAGFGAAAAILLSMNVAGIKLMSFAFGMLAVMLTWFISSRFGRGNDSLFLLILGGIIISSLFQSLISLVKYVADPTDQLPAITFWLLGSLSKATMSDVKIMAIPFAVCAAILILCSSSLNILALGEEEARTLGVNTKVLRGVVISMATVLTAFAVSLCGMIGWVGLVIPHLARLFVGPNFKVLIPTSLLLGSAYLLIMDDFCRSALAVEIPLGIITSLAGLPFFLYLLTKKNKGW